jgi:ABC-type amino acid transport substrate-binding protein
MEMPVVGRSLEASPRWRGVLLGAVVTGASVLLLTGCGLGAAGPPFEPGHPGVLTVATAAFPAPGFWEGTPSAPTGGFEYELALDLAKHLGLSGIRVVLVPFARIASGHLGGADVALTQMTPTRAREKTADFTTPYLTAPPGILARPGIDASDLEGVQKLRWVALATSTLTPILMNTVRPLTPPLVVGTRNSELAALDSGKADAVLLDLPVAQGLARAEPGRYRVIGQLSGGEGLGVVLPQGSHNTQIVDSAVRALLANDTIGNLQSRWLGGSGGNIPLIRTES